MAHAYLIKLTSVSLVANNFVFIWPGWMGAAAVVVLAVIAMRPAIQQGHGDAGRVPWMQLGGDGGRRQALGTYPLPTVPGVHYASGRTIV